MQTFLPYKDFVKSAECLDNKRLGKQRVEVLQMLKALNGESKGWINHPAVKQWKGHENWLIAYGNDICSEWIHRGFKDTCRDKILKYSLDVDFLNYPPWLGNAQFHSSHRAALLAKDYRWYSRFGWGEEPKIEYYWPSKLDIVRA